MHKFKPWKSHRTEDLVENFVAFLGAQSLNLECDRSVLREIARFELAIFYARRLPSGLAPDFKARELSSLADLTVDETLACQCILPQTSRFESFSFDIVAAHAYFYENSHTFAEEFPKNGTFVGVSRGLRNSVDWVTLPPGIYNFMRALEPLAHFSLAGLAEAFVGSLPPDFDETRAFAEFLSFVSQASRSGLLQIIS